MWRNNAAEKVGMRPSAAPKMYRLTGVRGFPSWSAICNSSSKTWFEKTRPTILSLLKA